MSRHVIVLCFEGRRTETPVAYRRADDGALEALMSVHGAWSDVRRAGDRPSLCFEGRRTGKRYETPVAYRRADDGALEALTSVHGAWWRNLESGAPATVVHRGRTVPARVDVVRSGRLRRARGERRGGQARARLPRPPAPRHDAHPARGDRPPARLADSRDRPRRLTPLPPFNCFESPLPRLDGPVRPLGDGGELERGPAPPRLSPP